VTFPNWFPIHMDAKFPGIRMPIMDVEELWVFSGVVKVPGGVSTCYYAYENTLIGESKNHWFNYNHLTGELCLMLPKSFRWVGRDAEYDWHTADDLGKLFQGKVLKHFPHVHVLNTLIAGRDPDKLTKGLRAQFNLTDLTIKHDWARDVLFPFGDEEERINVSKFMGCLEPEPVSVQGEELATSIKRLPS